MTISHDYHMTCRLDGEDQECLSGSTLCIDPVYNVLWTYVPQSLQLSCYNPVAAEVKGITYLCFYTLMLHVYVHCAYFFLFSFGFTKSKLVYSGHLFN